MIHRSAYTLAGLFFATTALAALAQSGPYPVTPAPHPLPVPEDLPVPAPQVDPTPAPDDAAATDLVLLLDTSNSMDGLINQAKAQLWGIVRQFAEAGREGKPVKLRVALFEYGNNRLPATENYIRQVVPLTDNLDAVSAALFSLTTNGGSEYCGAVIEDALVALDWATHDQAYRTIFIAGNEPFTQGPVDYRAACGMARGKGVVVNTIHCGGSEEGRRGMWADGAAVGGGQAFNIDQDRAVPSVVCPQDARLLELNDALNKTYLWYGNAEFQRQNEQAQRAQDANAAELGSGVAAERAAVKSGSAYRNVGRDLVDTFADDLDKLAELPAEEMPAEMQQMTAEERVEHVRQMAEDRKKLQEEITQLAAERAAFLAEHAQANQADPTLGDAVLRAIRTQLHDAGFTTSAPTTRPN